MRFTFRFFLPILLLSVAALGAFYEKSPVREVRDLEYESARGGETSEPAVLRLNQIRQSPSVFREEEDIHEEGWEFYQKRNWSYNSNPIYSPVHSFSIDHPVMTMQALQGPVVQKKFPGIADTHPVQPDSRIAVGPNHVLLGVNYDFAIYTKSGQKLFQTSFAEWFKSLNVGTDNLYDPKLIYDQYDGHYIFLCDARRADKRSFYLFSVSKTSDPMGEWAYWLIDMGLNGTQRQDVLWADFPRVGIDQDAIYLTGNMTTFGSYLFKYAKIRVLKKSQVYNFQKLTWHDFFKMKDGTGFNAFSIEPAHSYGTTTAEYLVNTSPFTASVITLWNITGATTATPVLKKRAIPVSPYEFPPSAQQKGGGAVLATRECGVYNAVFINGFLYTAHNEAHDWGSGPVSAIRFYQLKTNGEVVQEITYGADKFFYFYPAVMADSNGNVVLGYNRSSATTFAGAFFTGRKAGDPPGKFQPAANLIAGQANYKVVFNGTDIGRWGDYLGIALDPNNSIWFYAQYAKTATEWGTQVARLAYP